MPNATSMVLARSDDPLYHFHFCSDFLSSPALVRNTAFLKQWLCTHPELMAVAQEVIRKHRSINVFFPDPNSMDCFGKWSLADKQITLVSQQDKLQLLKVFVFELLNANNDSLTHSYKDFKDPMEFAFAHEIAEFSTSKNCYQHIKNGVEKYQWPIPMLSLISENCLNFDKQYLKLIKTPQPIYNGYSHFDLYANDWIKNKLRKLDSKIKRCTTTVRLEQQNTLTKVSHLLEKSEKILCDTQEKEEKRARCIKQLRSLKQELSARLDTNTTEKSVFLELPSYQKLLSTQQKHKKFFEMKDTLDKKAQAFLKTQKAP